MKPIIGITCSHDWENARHRQNDTYIYAVLKAGGIPVLLPCLSALQDITLHLDLLNGLLISGGPDADPIYFGEEPQGGLGGVNPAMDAYEVPLILEALKRDMPILGICRGEQMLNIVAGGTLFQDMASAGIKNLLKHRQEAPRSYRSHSVIIAEGTKLSQILGAGSIRVNTFHHQAVKNAAPGFVVSAKAPDGVVEAIESINHSFVIGVQWHPEGMWNVEDNYDALFDALVGAATHYAKSR